MVQGDIPAAGPAPQATVLPIDSLVPNPHQPRSDFPESDIASLASSIERSGLLQPIIVRYHEGLYQIIAGERRWRAAKQCGITNIPVIIRKSSEEQMLELALVENLQRTDLNPVDRARAYRSFRDSFGLKAEDVAERLGEDRTTVVNYLRLLDLPEPILELVTAGQLGMGHARALLAITHDDRRLQLAEAAVRNELSVRALEDIARRTKSKAPDGHVATPTRGRPRSAHLRDLEQRFEEAMRTKVTIHEGKRKGSGRIVIQFFSLDDFDRLAQALGVDTES